MHPWRPGHLFLWSHSRPFYKLRFGALYSFYQNTLKGWCPVLNQWQFNLKMKFQLSTITLGYGKLRIKTLIIWENQKDIFDVRPCPKAKRQCCLFWIFIQLNFRFQTWVLMYPNLIRILIDSTHKWFSRHQSRNMVFNEKPKHQMRYLM